MNKFDEWAIGLIRDYGFDSLYVHARFREAMTESPKATVLAAIDHIIQAGDTVTHRTGPKLALAVIDAQKTWDAAQIAAMTDEQFEAMLKGLRALRTGGQ